MMDKVNDNSKNVLILGDLNIDFLKPHTSWQLITSQFGLKQFISSPTRVTHKSTSLIDHIYSNSPHSVSNVSVLPLAISDHYPVICTWSCKLNKHTQDHHKYITYRNIKKINLDAFYSDLSQTPFHEVHNHTNPDSALSIWLELFLGVLNKHAPEKRRRVRNRQPPVWLTEEIKTTMKLRNEAKKEKDIPQFKRLRNKVKYLVREAKKQFVKNTVEKNDQPSSVWSAINSLTGRTRHAKHTPSCVSAETFNRHFLGAPKALLQSNNLHQSIYVPPKVLTDFCQQRLSNSEPFTIPNITVHDVRGYISRLQKKMSSGIDGINGCVLNLAQPYIIDSLTYIYNLCINKNIFPTAFKSSKIIPIPKTGDTSDPNNYRPISLLPILSKPLEKHIHKHLLNYIEKNSLFSESQSGFRPKHSCHTALSQTVNSWLTHINDNKMTGVVFLDMRKAFDLINHDILLSKLHTYFNNEINAPLPFFRSYLANRKQCVFVNGQYSTEGAIEYGVPQGSVLGPLLFCLFINDLPLHVADHNTCTSCEMFADDSTLHSAASEVPKINDNLQQGLTNVSKWCSKNKMIINPSKTKCMLVTTRQKHQLNPPPLNLCFENSPIQQVNKHKLLGVIIDEQLSWKPHMNKICNTISRSIFMLSKLKPILDQKTRLLCFNAYIRSHIDYASTVWDGCGDIHMKKLNSLYKRALKQVLPESSFTTQDRLNTLSLLPLNRYLNYNKCTLMHKILHGKSPGYLAKLFHYPVTRTRTPRTNLIIKRSRIDIYKTSLSFSGAKLWNSLPTAIKSIQSLSLFKLKAHKYFTQMAR